MVALCDGSHIALANAGDARAVLCERGDAQPLTRDHTPALYSEAQRVIKVCCLCLCSCQRCWKACSLQPQASCSPMLRKQFVIASFV